MATTPANYQTPRGIIEMAMRDAGLLGKGAVPKGADYADGLMRLNEIAWLWQTQGIKLWLQQDYALTMTVGRNLYTFGPTGTQVMTKPTRLIEDSCYYQDSSGNRRPLIPMSRNEWDTLSVVTQQGSINQFYVDKQQLTLNVYLWLTPDSIACEGTTHLILQNQIGTAIQLTDTMNFPIEWTIALHWALADEICTGQPQAIMDRCATRAQTYRLALEEWDVEDTSVFMQPDTRTQFQGNRFV